MYKNSIDNLTEFVFSGYLTLDFDRIAKTFFFTVVVTILGLYIYETTVSKILACVFGFFCSAYYLFIDTSKERRAEPFNSIMVTSFFKFFLSIHMVCLSYLLLSPKTSPYILLLFILSVFAVGLVYVLISIRIIQKPYKRRNSTPIIVSFAGIGALVGFSVANLYLKPKYDVLTREQELQFIGIVLFIASLYTDSCFVGFLRAYYIKKYRLIKPQSIVEQLTKSES